MVYPLGTRLNWEFVSDQIQIMGVYYFLNQFAALGAELTLALQHAPHIFFSSFRFYDRSYSERYLTSQPRVSRVSFIIASSIVTIFVFIPLFIGLCAFTIAAIAVFGAIVISVVVAGLLGLLASILTWFLLYRIPVYDIIYPHVSTWMRRHNSAIYQRLPSSGTDTQTSYIRLVRIKPGRSRQTVECELITENIATADFDALSYVWGITMFPYEIKVNGNDFYVTYNLFSALCQLRRPDG